MPGVPIDLHTHSTASDGSFSPTALVEHAAERGIGTMALTDHDTLEGVAEARRAAEAAGVRLISGVELSLDWWGPGGMHMIALWLDDRPGPLQDRLAAIQAARTGRNARISARLMELGMDVTVEEIEEEAGGGSVGRPHIAAVMLRKGYVPDLQTAFDEYLATGRPAYFPRERLEPGEAIKLTIESGGVPILAHSHTLGLDNRNEVADTLERLVDMGLVGIECHYGAYDADERAAHLRLAQRFGLLPSGGSDFHGTYKPDVELGTGSVGLGVPDDILDALDRARS